jgi:hypothetical protein
MHLTEVLASVVQGPFHGIRRLVLHDLVTLLEPR